MADNKLSQKIELTKEDKARLRKKILEINASMTSTSIVMVFIFSCIMWIMMYYCSGYLAKIGIPMPNFGEGILFFMLIQFLFHGHGSFLLTACNNLSNRLSYDELITTFAEKDIEAAESLALIVKETPQGNLEYIMHTLLKGVK